MFWVATWPLWLIMLIALGGGQWCAWQVRKIERHRECLRNIERLEKELGLDG